VTTTAPPVTTTTTGATTTTTTQSGTTTTTTQVTTTTTSTQTTTTTLVGDEFDVTFLDWDGTVIDIVTVSPGGSATPPPDPTRPNTLSIIYAFTGWSGTFTNVQGDITVYATYSATPISNTEYTRADLLYMAAIVMETTDEEQLEGMLDQIMIMMDLSTEQELYDMMSMLATLKQDMMLMDSAAEMQGLLAKAQDLGFDDVLLGKIAANLIAMMLEQEEAYMQEDLLMYQGRITLLNQQITDYQAELASFNQTIIDFCSTTSSPNCYSLYEKITEIIPMQIEFQEFPYQYFDDGTLEPEVYYDFIEAVEVYHNAVLNAEEETVIQGYFDDYLAIFNSVGSEQQVILNQAFTQFIALNNKVFSYLQTAEELTFDEFVEFENYMLYGWYDEFDVYHESYREIYYEIMYDEDDIARFTERIAELTDDIAMFAYVKSYFENPLTAPKIQALVTMIYDGLYASAGVIDQEMIDFIESIMMMGYSEKYYGIPGMIYGMGGIQEIALSMTAEDITHMINKLGDILVAFESTLTPEEYTLIGDLIKEILPLAIMDPDMTQTDIDNLKLMVAGMVDYYLPTVFTTGSDLAHMLQTFTIEKTEALVSVVITMAIGMEMGLEDQMIVQVASALDILLGDDSLDITLLANTFIDIYFLVNLGPNHGTDLTAIKTAFTANITEIMALAADINGANKMALTPADFANMEELELRIMTLSWWVDNGFTNMSIDASWTYSQGMFASLLFNLGLDSTPTGITEIMTVLNATTEEQAYYLLRAMFNYATYFINVRDFADIQAWLANIDQFGLTESEVIDLVFVLVEVALEDDIYGISPEQEYYLEEIAYYTQRVIEVTDDLAWLEQQVDDYIAGLPAELQADATALWDAYLFDMNQFYIYNDYLNSIYEDFNWDDLDTIIWALDEIAYLYPEDSNYAADLAYYESEFDSVYDLLPIEKQAQIDILVNLHNNMMAARFARDDLRYSLTDLSHITTIADQILDYLYYDYSDPIYMYTYYLSYIEQLNGMISEKEVEILAFLQSVANYIDTVGVEKQADIQTMWNAYKLQAETETIYYFAYNKLYDQLSVDAYYVDQIQQVVWGIYFDPDNTATYNTQFDEAYNLLSLEEKAIVDAYVIIANNFYTADDAAYQLSMDLWYHETLDFTAEMTIIDAYWSDYSLLYDSWYYLVYDELVYNEDLLAEKISELEAVDQMVANYIATLDLEYQGVMTDLWVAFTDAETLDAQFEIYFEELYNYIDFDDLYNIFYALQDMYYYDQFNPDELPWYNDALDTYNGIYGLLSPEQQAMIDEFENMLYQSLAAEDSAWEFYHQLTSDEELDAIAWILEDFSHEYDYTYSDLRYLQGDLDFYQMLYDNYTYDNDAFVALHNMMLNNPEMVKALMQIMLDDAQNLFATMPADSFDEIFNLVRFMLLPHGSFKDFTPEDILALTQDLSSMLKLIGATMDETDDAAIALALQTYLGYLADTMEITGTEKTDFITQMSGLLIKYIGYAEITVDQFTLILDSLTIEEINMMVKFAHDAYSHRLSDFEMVVFGAAMINNILNIPGFDLDQLTDIYFEVYMDMNYEFTYDALDLQAIQDAFSSFMVDTKALITTVSMIDVTNMDTEDIANIMELMNRFEHMAWYFGNPDPTILTSYDFTYSNDQFIELVMMIFNATETEAPSVVTELVNLLGMSEEDAYYQVVGIMMVVRNLENARSIGDILNIYRGLRSVGLTNAEIAEYGMTLFMGLGYPTMMDSSSASYYQNEIDLLNQELASKEAEIANKHAYVLAEIEAVSDPVLKAYLLQVWGYSDDIFPADMDSYALIAAFQRNNYLDWWLYNVELRPVYISGIQADIDEVYWEYGLYEEEIAFYEALFAYEQANMALHQQYLNAASMIADPYYRDLIMNTHNQMVQLYIDIAGVNLDIEWYNMRLAEAENDLLMLTAIYNFLGDPVNQALVEDVLVILLDEVEAMSMDPNVKALDILMKFMQEPDLRYLDMNMMVMEMQSLSALMANMGSTIDLADRAVIAQLLNAFIIEYVDVLEIADPLQEAALLADLQGMAVLYLPQVLALPDVISAFLASMDEAKINQIMSILREYNWISWYHENAELKEAIVDAKLIMAIAGDDSLDYEAVIELVYGIYFDMNDMQGNTLPMTVTDMITEMDDLMLQAELLIDIGLFGITIDNADEVTLFMTMLGSMFNWEEDPVI
jgi:hypothetical protein